MHLFVNRSGLREIKEALGDRKTLGKLVCAEMPAKFTMGNLLASFGVCVRVMPNHIFRTGGFRAHNSEEQKSKK